MVVAAPATVPRIMAEIMGQSVIISTVALESPVQEEQNGPSLSFIAPSSEELLPTQKLRPRFDKILYCTVYKAYV